MSKTFQKIAFLFPGQGSQYPGMAQDFIHNFSAARLTFEEADEILKYPLSKIILEGPEDVLKETKNSQTAIYVTSMAICRVVQELYNIKPFVCAGLSLGEYTALTVGEWLSFRHALPLVAHRGQFMNDACQSTKGTMVVVMGLEANEVEEVVKEIHLPGDLWIANFNCPGQIVISGTLKGIEAGIEAFKNRAKRVVPLQVSGAFHSGLMQTAKEKLTPFILDAPLVKGSSELVMNVSGKFVSKLDQIQRNLIEQVTHSVRWEQGIREIDQNQIDLFIEFGPGKTLSAMNKRIGVKAQTISIEKVEDLNQLSDLEIKGEFS